MAPLVGPAYEPGVMAGPVRQSDDWRIEAMRRREERIRADNSPPGSWAAVVQQAAVEAAQAVKATMSKLTEARQWVAMALAPGPMRATKLQKLAEKAGIIRGRESLTRRTTPRSGDASATTPSGFAKLCSKNCPARMKLGSTFAKPKFLERCLRSLCWFGQRVSHIAAPLNTSDNEVASNGGPAHALGSRRTSEARSRSRRPGRRCQCGDSGTI
jgi:hypothetical protein